MSDIRLFENRRIRSHWDSEQEKWYFSIVDVIAVLTDQTDYQAARNYWKVLKNRLKKEGNETVTNCNQLKMPAIDGKMRLTDVADTEQLLRLIQSVPSPKAEPFKQWLAKVGSERLDQIQDPELGIQQALQDYRRLGYSADWINQRLKSIEIRKELTDEWHFKITISLFEFQYPCMKKKVSISVTTFTINKYQNSSSIQYLTSLNLMSIS